MAKHLVPLLALTLAAGACTNNIVINTTGGPRLPGKPTASAEPAPGEGAEVPAEGPGPITVPVIIVDVSNPDGEPAATDPAVPDDRTDVRGDDPGFEPPADAAPRPLSIVGVEGTPTRPGFPASRAVDGDTDTEWGTGQEPNGALTLSFNQEAAIASVTAKTGPTPAGARLLIETSTDGQRWTTALVSRNDSWAMEAHTLPGAPVARHVRLRYDPGSSGKPGFSVFEVTVQASRLTSGPAPAPVASRGPVTGPTIAIYPEVELHRAESRLLGTNRNHVTSDFPNGQAKLAKLRELTPRWGDRQYLYRIGHGPTDGRNDYAYMTGYHFEQSWNKLAPYPYDDIREGLKDAEAIGADQMHVVNFGTSNPAEAGRYVSYLNKSGDANRAKYPHAQQNVKRFEIGNEIAWSMVRGHSQYAANERVYAERARLFAQEMRRNSDGPILIGANGSINSNWEGNGWSGGATTVKNILTIMGDQVDFLIYHGYPSWPLYKAGNLLTIMAQNEWNRQKLENEIKPAIRAHAGGRDVFIANTEFFTHLYNDVSRSRGLFGALYSADTLTLAFNQDIRTAVQFCFEHKDMADASFFINHDPENTTAIFKFQKLLAEHWGDTIVKSEGRSLPTVFVDGDAVDLTLPKLAFAAAKSDGKVFVMVTHRTDDADVTANVDVGFAPSRVTAYELSDPAGWNAANAEVRVREGVSLAGYRFPKASVTIFEVER